MKSEVFIYVLGLLFSVITWQVSQVIKEVSETRAITYDFKYFNNDSFVRLSVNNISSKLPLESLDFHVTCLGSPEGCIAPLPDQPSLARHFVVQPIGSTSLAFGEMTSSEISFNLSLPPGESVHVDIGVSDDDYELGFYFQPGESARGLDILFLDSKSLFARMVDNYIGILLCSLFFVGGVLLGFVVYWVFRCLGRKEVD